MKETPYAKWYVTCSPAEAQLRLQAIKYEERYFRDLTLQEARIRKRILRWEEEEDGRMVWYHHDTSITLGRRWIFRYCPPQSGSCGDCNFEKRTIRIFQGFSPEEEKSTLLHEMIHAYESMLSPTWNNWLLLDLNDRMRRVFGPRKVRRWIDLTAHIMAEQSGHSCFFLLKSIDLDARLDWQVGTTFAYGRKSLFS